MTKVDDSGSGVCRIMLEGNYLFDVIDFESDLNKYKVIILLMLSALILIFAKRFKRIFVIASKRRIWTYSWSVHTSMPLGHSDQAFWARGSPDAGCHRSAERKSNRSSAPQGVWKFGVRSTNFGYTACCRG